MPTGGLLDHDHALDEGPRLVEQGALRQQVAGRVAPDVAGVRGQVEQLVVAAEHDLDLLDRRAIALEPVVDPAADEPREPSWASAHWSVRALADRRVAVLERDGRGGSSWRLATSSAPRLRA